jgi:hypothetical protein
MILLGEFITFQQAMEKETKTVRFVFLDGIYIGKKLGNELFCDFKPDFETVKALKKALKVYKPIVVPDPERPMREALLTNTGQYIYFTQDIVYYDGIIKPILFSKLYTSDVFDVQPFSLLARSWNGEFDLQTAQKKYLEAMTS